MRKNNKQKDKTQMDLNFQVKELTQAVKPRQSSKAVQVNKSAKIIKARHSNTDLSKKSNEIKVKEKTCGRKPSGLFFDNLITVEELAVIFGLAPQTIRNWVAQGKLPYVKIGKRNCFLRGSLQEWLNRKEKPQWQ